MYLLQLPSYIFDVKLVALKRSRDSPRKFYDSCRVKGSTAIVALAWTSKNSSRKLSLENH